MDLKQCTTEELQGELARRVEAEKAPMPEVLFNPDYTNLTSLCKEYLRQVAKNQDTSDLQHYIFEAAIEAAYGRNVWKWINGKH